MVAMTLVDSGQRLAAPHSDMAIGACTDKPGMSAAPLDLQYSKAVLEIVSPQNLQGNNERVSHQITEYPGVEDLDGSIIRR
jgi:hypothetical protein